MITPSQDPKAEKKKGGSNPADDFLDIIAAGVRLIADPIPPFGLLKKKKPKK